MDQLIAFHRTFGSCVLGLPQKDYFFAVPWRGSFGRIWTMQLEPPKGGARALLRGDRGQALTLPRQPVLSAGSRGLLLTGCGCGPWGVGTGDWPLGLHALPDVARRGGGRMLPGGGSSCCGGGGGLGLGVCSALAARPSGRQLRSASHRLWVRTCGGGDPALAPSLACPSGHSPPWGCVQYVAGRGLLSLW